MDLLVRVLWAWQQFAFKSLLEQLGFLEAEQQRTKARAESAKLGALRVRMEDTRRFVKGKLRELQKLLNAKPRMARIELGKYIQKRIVLKPEGKKYVAVGDWNLLAVVSYDGAGPGMDRTSTRSIRVAGGGLALNYIAADLRVMST